ncbi:transposase [Rivularia sp. UHCC 0363]|uniref:transposase n=1 Tax=Rivularia sp. UHCC 0363 TaxID=3110244 RepID=UPI002B1EB2A6|nr:transposase [Rivularia sp. UHCC 0363]MEA5593457.1 transposase [Rivularia sp. UHCC 0363]
MPKTADIGSKRLISLSPDAWVKWVTQSAEVSAREILASEFQWISRESDVVVKAHHPQVGNFLVLNELQLRYDNRSPRRIRAYAALAEEKYDLPVYPVLINILQPPQTVEIANNYRSQVLGLQARQDYRVINLWEVDVQLVFQQSLSSLLPFVPILKGGNEVAVVQQAVQLLRADEKLDELEPLLAFFASFVLSTQLVQQIMRWDMTVLQESPWYQEILNQGEIKGLLSGIELGLELKFGSEGLHLMSEISQIKDLEVLTAIREGIRTKNTLEEIRQIYQADET